MPAALTTLSGQSAPTGLQPIDSRVAEQFQVGWCQPSSHYYCTRDFDSACTLSDLAVSLCNTQVGDAARLPPSSSPAVAATATATEAAAAPFSYSLPVSRSNKLVDLADISLVRLHATSLCNSCPLSRTNGALSSSSIPTLRPLTGNFDEIPMATTAASVPGSPPDLSGSRSSKSSSYCSTSDSDGHDTLATLDTNFEEITLDDDNLSNQAHQLKPLPPPPPPQQQQQQQPQPQPAPAVHHPSYALVPKATAPSQRPHGLQAQIREAIKDTGLGVSVQKEIRTTAAHSRRGFTSPATSFLTANALPTRPRSSSPPKVGRNGLPSTRLSPDRLRPNWHSPSSRPVSSRTRSFQSNRRRSVQELEAEYHDSDDDLPDDASLWNVPVSPNPGLKSRSPSFCASSGKPSMASSPRPIPLDHHTPHPDTSLGRSPPSQRLPKRRRPQPLRSASLNIPVNAPPRKTERFAHPSRTRSWNTAMSELSEEARILSESLQHHAEIQRLSQMESTPLRSRTDPATMKPKASSIQLPPVQRGNLDFMPISKEKEAILSRTRPSWLPPKDPKEEKKHLKEYQQMMAASLEAEKKRNEQARTRQDRKEVDAECSPDRIWQSYSADTTDLSQIDRRVFSLCWRGVSPNLRARVWQQTIGNELGLNAKSFQLALDRAKDIQSASEQGLLCRERTMRRWLIDIERDAETAFPELGLFQRNAPLWQALIDVCKAYACYRSEIGYVYGLQLVAALILLQTPSTADAFVLLANALNRPAPLAFQSGGLATMTRIYNHAVDTLAIKFPRLHEYLFGSIESGGLGLTPAVIFEPMFKTLFCNGLDVDRLCRVWDIWVFDGDRTLVRTAVAILGGCLQSQIFAITGDIDLKRRNIQEMLAWGPFNRNSRGQHWQLPSEMGEDGFIEEIRLAGRLDYMGK